MIRKSEWNIMMEVMQHFYREGYWIVQEHTVPAKILHFGDRFLSPAAESA